MVSFGSLGEFSIIIKADDRASGVLGSLGGVVGDTLGIFQGFGSGIGGILSGVVSSIKSMAKTATISFGLFTAAATATFAALVKGAADFEQTNVAFSTLLGSTEKAHQLLKDLADFAVRTPFEIEGVEDAAQRLLAVGFAADDVIPTLRNLGDVASIAKLDTAGFDRLIRNLGQVRSLGKVTTREMNDFANAGIPIRDILAKSLNVTANELSEMIGKGEVSSDQLISAFKSMSEEGGIAFNAMGKQSGTLIGRLNELKESVGLVRRELGQPLLDATKKGVGGLAEGFNGAVNSVRSHLVPVFERLGQLMEFTFKDIGELSGGGLKQVVDDMVAGFAMFAQSAGIAVLERLPGIIDAAVSGFNALSDFVQRVRDAFGDRFGEIMTRIGDQFERFFGIVLNQDMGGGFMGFIDAALTGLESLLGFVEGLPKSFETLFKVLTNFKIIADLMKFFFNLFGAGAQFLIGATQVIATIMKGMQALFTDVFGHIAITVAETFKSVVGTIVRMINSIIEGVNKVRSAVGLGEIGQISLGESTRGFDDFISRVRNQQAGARSDFLETGRSAEANLSAANRRFSDAVSGGNAILVQVDNLIRMNGKDIEADVAQEVRTGAGA